MSRAVAPSPAQRSAADPRRSVWVSANAGSGKTRVLTERVARLLLGGARPERILCLTYTRAAAAEMADRLAKRLGGWALLEDADLAGDLAALTGEPEAAFPPERLRRARTLFAEALETPGGLKIQTIHAFCDSVLRRFPAEAGVAPGFEVIEDAQRAEMAQAALETMARAAASGEDDAFDLLAADLSEESLKPLLDAILSHRALFRPPPAPERLAALFGVEETDLSAPPFAGLSAAIPADLIRGVVDRLRAKAGKTGVDFAEALSPALTARNDPGLEAALRPALRTASDAPRGLSKIVTKAAEAAFPGLSADVLAVQEAYEAARARDAARSGLRAALALNRFAERFLDAFEAEKRAVGALDYDDLIEAVRALLADSSAAQWALYKLDGGVDHILLDEAQDTSPAQWLTTQRLIEELHAGEGARGGDRTLFVVGDEKQSIYSFQGAAPKLFAQMREHFRTRFEAAGREWDQPRLDISYRSANTILRIVDETFIGAAQEGMSADRAPLTHAAFKRFAGRVDLWPALEPEPQGDPPHWARPLDLPPPDHPKLKLAQIVAREIHGWIGAATLPGGARTVRAGDVLVLVRKRDQFASELLRQLKALGAPVAGADRMRLTEEIAVKDLLALIRFALTPEDDLTLAALLRSPLCGLSEEALFALAHPRPEGQPLWAALRGQAEAHPQAMEALRDALDKADYLRPFEFLSRALAAQGGRRRLLARLGAESEDAMDELLSAALAYEQGAAPTLGGFLDAMAAQEVSLKREMDKGRDEVRVMTVHGAKGLEAPVVVLVDVEAAQGGGRPAALHEAEDRDGKLALRGGAGAAAVEEAKAARAQAEAEESRRLLYVAMTRAERWLVVARAGKPPAKRECWHGLVAAGVARYDGVAERMPAPEGLEGEMLRFESGHPDEDAAPETKAPPPPPAAPEWLRRPAPRDATPPLRAASALGAPDASGGAGLGAEAAKARGLAIHACLELPPDADPARRAALLAALPEDQRAAAAAEVEAALALMREEGLLEGVALVEAELALDLPELGFQVAGRVDRVALTPSAARLIDFKTDARPPETADQVSLPYLRQLGAYAEALRRIHPDKTIEAMLLYTAAPRLIRPSEAQLRAALTAAS